MKTPCLFSLIISSLFLPAAQPLQIRVFPTEAEMDSGGFVLIAPRRLEIQGETLYVLDQREHAVHLFDLAGNYRSSFGGYGYGPGELLWPHTMTVNETEILIVDKRGTFHRYDLTGNFLGSQIQMDFFDRLVHTTSGLFGHVIARQNDYAFALLTEGNRSKTIEDHFQSNYSEEHYNRSVEMKYQDGLVYVLQRYGGGFRIYKDDELQHGGALANTPLDDPYYQELGVKFTFMTFAVLDGHFFAVYMRKGSLGYYLFNASGKIIQRGHLELKSPDIEIDELVNLTDVTFHPENDGYAMYCLVRFPVAQIVKYTIDPDFLKLQPNLPTDNRSRKTRIR